jgi:MFS family permease
MAPDPAAPPVSRLDRVLGALVTFSAAGLLGFIGAYLLAPEPDELALSIGLAAAVLAGVAAAGGLVFARGYDRLLIPVEGRRWTIELVVALAVVVGAFALADAFPDLPDLAVFLVLGLGLLATSRLGHAIANARSWYDQEGADSDRTV